MGFGGFGRYIFACLLSLSILTGCGGGSGSDTTDGTSGSITTTYATAQLGNLANATVEIFEVEDNGSLTLKWSEQTSSGDRLDEIGKFDLHAQDLKPDRFYLYKVSGGEDWDADDDGVKDANYTLNRGTVRAVAKGSEIIDMGEGFRVTAVSEIVYEKVAKILKYDFNSTTFDDILNQSAAQVVDDIDGDGIVDIKDLLRYDPVADKERLKELYRLKLNEILDTIHQGKTVVLSLDSIVGSYGTSSSTHEVAISSDGTKAYLADGDNGLVIIDITDPANPTQLGSYYDTAGYAFGVALSGDGTKAYLADGGNGLIIIDIDLPPNLVSFPELEFDCISGDMFSA